MAVFQDLFTTLSARRGQQNKICVPVSSYRTSRNTRDAIVKLSHVQTPASAIALPTALAKTHDPMHPKTGAITEQPAPAQQMVRTLDTQAQVNLRGGCDDDLTDCCCVGCLLYKSVTWMGFVVHVATDVAKASSVCSDVPRSS